MKKFLLLTAALLLAFGFVYGQTTHSPKQYLDLAEHMLDPQGIVVIQKMVVNDFQCISNPGNPPTGLVRVYCDSNTGNFTCLTSTGASCISSGGGTLTGSGTLNTIPKWTAATALGNSSVTDDGVNPVRSPNGVNTATSGDFEEYTVDTGGVSANLALCVTSNVDGNGRAKVLACSHSASTPGAGFVGIANASVTAGNTVIVCWTVNCSAKFDNQTTALDEAIMSTTTDGQLHDTGSQTATAGQPNFAILNANSGVGTASLISLTGMLAQNPQGGGGGGKSNNVQVNGTNTQPTLNLNSTTPAPGAGFVGMTFASSNSGNTTSAVAKVAISGNTSTLASASTISGTTNICGDGSGNLTSAGCAALVIPGVTNIQGTSYTLLTSDFGKLVSANNASAVTITLPAPGGAAPQVQTSAETFITCNPTCTGKAFTPTAGDLVVIWVENNQDSTTTVTGVTANHATFHSAGAKQGWSTSSDTVWYAFNVGSGADTYTFAITGANVTLAIHIVEYNNIQTSSDPKDAYQTANGTTAVPSSGNATINFNNELVTGMIPAGSCNLDTATGSGYTLRVADASMASNGMIEDKAVSTSGTYVADATAAGCVNWAAILTSFRMTTSASFSNGFYSFIQNRGTNTVTLSRGSATIDGASANLVLQPNQGVFVMTDGTNWFTERGAIIDFPDVTYVRAAVCNNATGSIDGWSIGASGSATCRAGTNNLGGIVSITDTANTFATFQLHIPEDWDTGTNPYIRFDLASTDATNGHTIIPSIQVACYKGDGTTTDDVAANAAHSLSTVTLNGNANRFWSTANVQMNSTDVTGCVAGALMQVTVGRATDTATNAQFYGAVVTIPRLTLVKAN